MSSFSSWWKEQGWGINLAKKNKSKEEDNCFGSCLGCSSPEPAVSLFIQRDTGMVCGRKKAIHSLKDHLPLTVCSLFFSFCSEPSSCNGAKQKRICAMTTE